VNSSSSTGRKGAASGSSLTPQHEELIPLLAEATTTQPGAGSSLDDIIPVLYEELRRLARRELQRERPGHTLSTTGLAHEAYLELSKLAGIEWKSRAHFFGVCARVIRNVLVDYAVARKAQKRGGGVQPLPLEAADQVSIQRPQEWIDLDEALKQLAAIDARHARVVECRFFAGMSVEETAEALGISPATVKREWALARAWLNDELSR
jgi:RNA polymerase sigma factor (TIGR02999 family)